MVRFLFLLVLACTHVAAAGKVQQLFNGKDLSGWTFDNISPNVAPDTIWSIKDGMIVCKGRPPGVIRTAKSYRNYELTVEWRWAPGSKPENSGILVHASKPRETYVWPKSIEVQLEHQNAGDFWMIGETLLVPGAQPEGRRWIKKGKSHEKPVGEWNVARITCSGNTIKVFINDVLVNEGVSSSATEGAICLQGEGGEIHFRKVDLVEVD